MKVVDAWAAARASINDLPRLVIGGTLGDVATDVRRSADQMGVEVILTGRLSDDDLAMHLRHAAVVVQPSADEGFGLQPLEALASGAPVVVTAGDAVLEVVGDCAIVCDSSTSDLAHGIAKALQEAARLRGASRARSQAFSWDASADAALLALEDAARRRRR